jgi:hypothetical protein
MKIKFAKGERRTMKKTQIPFARGRGITMKPIQISFAIKEVGNNMEPW